MKDTVIALFSNTHGAGKTEAANYLWKKQNSRILSFSTPIKTMTKAFLREAGLKEPDIDIWMSPCQKDRRIGIKALGSVGTPRHIMQTLGTEWGRNCISDSVWTDMMDYRIARALKEVPLILIDDMRFANEADMLYDCYHTYFIRINGPEKWDPHTSEQDFDSIRADFEVDNTDRPCGLSPFLEQIDKIYDEIMKRGALRQ